MGSGGSKSKSMPKGGLASPKSEVTEVKTEERKSSVVSILKDSPKGKEVSKEKEPKSSKTPSKLQLEKWISSINALLSDDEGLSAFEAFLVESENEPGEYKKYIDFYRDCNDFKRKMSEMEAEAKRIYETYLEVGSEYEVGTRGKGEDVGEKLEEEGFPQKNLFDETQNMAKDKLDEGHYVNFRSYLKEKYKL